MIARAAVALLVGLAGSALAAAPASATSQADDPVRLAVSAPAVVSLDLAAPITVTVSSNPGAFDIADAPIRLRVRLSPALCRNTFDTTSGSVAIDSRLALPPRPSPAFTQTITGHATPSDFETDSVCAFVEEEGSNRLFAIDADTQVVVSRACTAATRRQASLVSALAGARQTLAQVQRRLAQARRRLARRHHARGRHRARRRRLARRRVTALNQRASALGARVAALNRDLGTALAQVRSACS
jgi:hypothetical protein